MVCLGTAELEDLDLVVAVVELVLLLLLEGPLEVVDYQLVKEFDEEVLTTAKKMSVHIALFLIYYRRYWS